MQALEKEIQLHSDQDGVIKHKDSTQSIGSNLKKNTSDFRVLIVDDEPDLLEMLAYDLESAGYKIETASGGNQALVKFKNNSYDLVITDIRMPDGDGLSLLKNVKAINADIPVLCITGFSDSSNQSIMNMGAFAVLEKPFDFKALHSTLLKVLGISSH